MPSITFRIDEKTKRLLENKAKEVDKSVSQILKELVSQYLGIECKNELEELREKVNNIEEKISNIEKDIAGIKSHLILMRSKRKQ